MYSGPELPAYTERQPKDDVPLMYDSATPSPSASTSQVSTHAPLSPELVTRDDDQ